jgi:ABC-type multidrug transport system fused ATPase/permease subunit
MLGQTTLVQGSHVLNARVAYAGQEHWIQNLSVRDNILFDSTMNESMYEMVMDAAQLSKDLLMLPNADLTEIGERGINLSGGQKARVNVARTLYAPNAELYVFDDPLAAVDVHVGKALFKSVFMDLLGKETRVIVFSSNYHFLPYFSKIVVVEKDGFVHVCESYGDLKARFPQYASADGEAAFEDHDQEENEGNAPSPVTDSGPQLDGQDASASASSELSGNKPCLAEEETKDSEENNCKSNLSNRQRDAHMYRSIRDITQLSSSTNNITKTVTKEDRETGEVSAATYGRYFSAALGEGNSNGGMFVIVVLALAFAIGQVFRVYSDLWVGMWGGDEFSQPVSFYYIVYSGLTFGTIMFAVLRAYYFIVRCLNASRNLHDSLLKCVLAAPVNTYFDVTPVGRILNRFSKDLDSIDCNLPDFFLNMLQNGFHVFSAVVMCVVSTPFFLIVMLPLAIMFYFVQSYYRKSSRELKRLESIARSPMYTLFGELLVGLSTVRAFAREEAFIKKFHSVQDYQNKFFVTFWVSSRWLALRLDLLSSGCVVSVALIAVLMKMYGGHVNSNLLGVALVFSLQLAGLLQWAVRSVIETENNMTSVERLLAFRSIEPEGHHYSPDDSVVPQDWPSEGSITMRNVTLCYRPGLPRVLDGVDFSIPGGSKVGVCGRTGDAQKYAYIRQNRI